MNLDATAFTKAMNITKETAMVTETTVTDNATPVQVEAEPPIIQAGFDAPPAIPSIEDAVDFRIANALVPVIAKVEELDVNEDTVMDIVESNLDISDKVTDAVDEYFSYNIDIDSMVTDALESNFDPRDYDILTNDNFDPDYWDLATEEYVTEAINDALQAEREQSSLSSVDNLENEVSDIRDNVNELTSALDSISDNLERSDVPDGLSTQLSELFDRLDAIESRLDNASISI